MNKALAQARTLLAAGATVIEVNPHSTPLSSRATVVLTGAAGKLLPQLVA